MVLLPALGGRIRDLTIAGRQWLWHNPEIPFAVPPADATSYVLAADSGGWDECAPTIAPCTLDAAVLVDHGDLWSQRAAVAIDGAGAPDFERIATHLCDSMKRYLDAPQRRGVHGEFKPVFCTSRE